MQLLFRAEFLKNSAAVCISVKIPTGKVYLWKRRHSSGSTFFGIRQLLPYLGIYSEKQMAVEF